MKTRIATLGALLFTVLAIGASGLRAESLQKDKYLTVAGLELYEVADGRETLVDRQDLTPAPAPTAIPTMGEKKKPTSELGDIVNIGKFIWEIIEKNRPVINQQYTAISAVPYGVKSWDELENWSVPTIKIYKMVYTNVYKMKVVEFEYRVAFTANGTYQGKGKYLSRVEIEPKTLTVAWGYKFDATGLVLNVTNVGTKDAPMAAMELNLNWQVSTLVKAQAQSVRYYIRGDGLLKNIGDGSIAPN